MRSSERTIVSRTIVRIASVRRRRRGRFECVVAPILMSLPDRLFVVISPFPEKRLSAVGRTEPPSCLPERAIGTEPLPAHHAAFQVRFGLRITAADAAPFVDFNHVEPKFSARKEASV